MELNVDNPLMRWKKIRLSNGKTTQVDFKYERLHMFYFICGKHGHSERFCEIPYNNNQVDSPRGWGTFSKAFDRRNQVVTGNRWLHHEAGRSGQVEEEGDFNAERNHIRQSPTFPISRDPVILRTRGLIGRL